jgi:hypothetical protein
MLYGILLYFSSDIYNYFNKSVDNIKSPKILEYQNRLKIINTKIAKKTKIAIINIIEKNNVKHKIFTKSISIQDNKIDLKISGDFNNIINILDFYQTHFVIIYYKIDNASNKI